MGLAHFEDEASDPTFLLEVWAMPHIVVCASGTVGHACKKKAVVSQGLSGTHITDVTFDGC